MTAHQTIPSADPNLACAADGTVFRNPARPQPKRDVRGALHKFRELIKDKENTALVFEIYEALPSKQFLPRARALTLSEEGQALRQSEPFLPPILDDHAALRKLPAGSVAHAYCDFMEREGLSAAGLVAESEKAGRPQIRRPGRVVRFPPARYARPDARPHRLRPRRAGRTVRAAVHPRPAARAGAPAARLRRGLQHHEARSRARRRSCVRCARRSGSARPARRWWRCRSANCWRWTSPTRASASGSRPQSGTRRCHAVWKAEGIDPYDLLGKGPRPRRSSRPSRTRRRN